MKRIKLKLLNYKENLVRLLIGRYYTEKEVKEILSKMQYEMAQRIIGNRRYEEPIVPMEFWMKNGKYDTNFYNDM